MKKRLKCLLTNKGMTLVELIVAMFLTTVILAIALGMFASTKGLMNTMNSNAHMDTMCATVDEYIRGTLQTAKSLQFYKLENSDNDFSAFKEDITKFIPKESGSKVKALAILNIGTGDVPVYRIYDFGITTSFDNLKSDIDLAKTSSDQLEEAFGVFHEAFYEGTSCAIEVHKADSSRLQVASQCQRDSGKKDSSGKPIIDIINQKHILNFNLLNNGTIDGTGVETKFDYTEQLTGHCYLILYTLP